MKKNKKGKPPEISDAIKKERITPANKIEEGGANASFPQEYEEQRSMNLRMKPQPLVKPEKSAD